MKVYIHTDIEGVAGIVEWDPRNSRYTDIEKFEKRRVNSRRQGMSYSKVTVVFST